MASIQATGPTTAEALVTAFLDAWEVRDLERALSLCSDDCVFEATEPAPDGTRYVGHDAIRAVWQQIFDDSQSSFETEELFGAGDRVVQRWCYRFADGHVRGVDLFRVRGDKIAEKLSYVKG